MLRERFVKAFALLAFVLALNCVLYAQGGTTSRISGVVADSNGAPVTGAAVILLREGTSSPLTTQTNDNGQYAFDLIQAGIYQLTVEKQGFKKFVSTSNPVSVNVPVTLNVTLPVGDVSAVVTVVGAGEPVQTSTSGNVGSIVETKSLESLPIVGTRGRNPLDLLNFQPGVVTGGNTGGGVQVHGSRDRAFNFTLDGIDINESTFGGSNSTPLKPNPESVQEFQVVTSNPTAELGRSSGAQVSFVTRSGTNQFHGNVFEFYQTPRFNARSYPETIANAVKGQFVQHIFGGSFGGPIPDIGLGEGRGLGLLKDKAFFFLNLQMLRAYDTALVTRTVYTANARAGLYRYVIGVNRVNAPAGTANASVDTAGNPILPVCVGSPPTNQPCISSYNAVTSAPNSIDPYLQGLLNGMPLPNNFTAGDGLNTAGYSWGSPQREKQRDFVTKIDYIANKKNAFYVRYGHGDQNTYGDSVNGGRPAFPNTPRLVDTFRAPRNLAINWRTSPTPKLTNEFSWGLSKYGFIFDTPQPDPLYPFAFVNPTDSNFNDSFNARFVRTLQYLDNVTYDLSPHTIKAGINFRVIRHIDDRYSVASSTIEGKVSLSSAASLFTNYNLPTAGTNSIASTDLTRLRGTLTDLIGHVGSITRAFVSDPNNPNAFAPGGTRWNNEAHYNEYDFYLQDTWKIRSNLLVDAGVRWEIKMKPSVNGRPILVPDQAVKLGAAASNTLRWKEGELFKSNFGLFLPSVGIVWDPFKDSKTSIRANYRMATDRFPTFLFGSSIFQSTPGNNVNQSNTAFGQAGGLYRNYLPVFNALTPAGTPDSFRQPAALSSSALSVVDPDLTYPQVHSFMFSVQREITKSNVFEFNFIRKHAVHLSGGYNINQTNILATDARCPGQTFLAAFTAIKASNAANCMIQLLRQTSGAVYTPDLFRTEFSADLAGNSVANIAQTFARRSGTGSLTAAGFSPFFFMQYPQYAGGFNVFDSSDYSNYTGLEFILKRRFNAGLTYQLAYTWSVSKDNRSFDPTQTTVSTGTNQSASSTPFDLTDRSKNYTWSDFDRRHVFQATFVYELPFGKGRRYKAGNSFVDAIVGGWQLSGTLLWQSGRPFTVYSGFNTFTNIVSSTANCTGCTRDMGKLVIESGKNFWFDATARAKFSNPNPGELGNTGRNFFLTPGYFQPDLSILRKFKLTERVALDLRVDARNMLNHPSFDLPTAVLSSPTFGRINDSVTSSPRRVQISGKLSF